MNIKLLEYSKGIFKNYGKIDCLNISIAKIIYIKLKIIDKDYNGFEHRKKTLGYNNITRETLFTSYKNGYDDIIKLNILTILKQKYENKSSNIKKR